MDSFPASRWQEPMTFSIHKCQPMLPTRPCLYCLSFNNSCVFADFDLADDRLYIVRISFDGHGCYRLDDPTWSISPEDSSRMIDWIESDNVDHDAMRGVLTEYLCRRKTSKFDDALVYNGLPG